MMVALTNTEGPEDFHINDWMVQSGLAVYGNMVCMRPRNYPLQRYLECKLLNSPDSGKELLSSDSKNVNLTASDARIESNLLKKRNFYDRLLKLHREARARKDSASNKESFGEESDKRRFSQGEKLQEINVVKVVEEKIVTLGEKPTHASDGSSSVSCEESFNRKKLKDMIEAHRKRMLHRPVDDVPKNQPSQPKIDQAALQKNFHVETPTDESTTDEERKLFNPNEIVPLHFKSSESINSFSEFGTLRSRYGGQGRMEPIDWSLASKTRDSEKKPKVPNLTKSAVAKVQKTVEEPKRLSDGTANKNDDNDNWTGPKIPLSKRALWNLVKNSEKQNSSVSSEVESEKNKQNIESDTTDENGISVKKKTPIFSITENTDVSRTEKYGRKGEKCHWESVPLRGMKKTPQNLETLKEALKLKEKEKFPKYAVLSNLPKADKRFIRIINDVVLSKSAEDESAFVPEGNIEMRKDRKSRLRVMAKKLQEKRKERVKMFIPERILHAMRREDCTRDSSDDQAANLSLSHSEEMKTSSESMGEMDEGSIPSLDSANSRSLTDFLQLKDSSSEKSSETLSCPSDRKSTPSNKEDSSSNEKKLCSSIEKSSNTGQDPVKTEAISKSPKETNAWFQDVRPKLSTPQRSLIRSNVNNTFNSTLDSDDLSLFEENKVETSSKVDSSLSSVDNSPIEELIAKDARDESPEPTNQNCSDDSDENKKLTSGFSKAATPKDAPVFDDLNLESNDDEWDYSPGWLPAEVAPEARERITNYPNPSTGQSVVIEELDAEKNVASDGSDSFEISENIDDDTRSNGSSGHETETDTQKTSNKISISERDSAVSGNLRKDSRAIAKSYLPLDNEEPCTSSPSSGFPSEKNPLIDVNTNSSSNDESPRRNASLRRSLSSAKKRYSILNEIQKSPILNKSLTFAALDSSSSDEKSDTSYKIPFVRSIRNYF